MKKIAVFILLSLSLNAQTLRFNSFSPKWQKETVEHYRRLTSDGVSASDLGSLNELLTSMKADNTYTSAKILCDPNWGVKVDGSDYVSKLYNVMGATGDLIQSTAANQPKLIVYKDNSGANTQRRTLLFDGSNDYLKTASMTLNQPEVVYMGLRQVSWTLYDFVFDGYSTYGMGVYATGASPKLTLNAGTISTGNTNLSIGSFGVMKFCFNGASSSIQVNNTSAVITDAGTNNASGFTLGVRGGADNYWSNIESGTILILNAVPTATQDQRIKDRLMARWKL